MAMHQKEASTERDRQGEDAVKESKCDREKGTILLEGVFGVFVSIVIMTLLLSLGFYLYQRTMIGIVANEIAEEVVMTYRYKDVKSCRNISLSDIETLSRYRHTLFAGQFHRKNESKGAAIANERLPKTTLAKGKGNAVVSIEKIADDVGRMHYEVTLTQEYEFMLGGILDMVGIPSREVLSATVYVDSIDISNYINTVKMTNYGLDKFEDAVPILKAVTSVIKLLQSAANLSSE